MHESLTHCLKSEFNLLPFP